MKFKAFGFETKNKHILKNKLNFIIKFIATLDYFKSYIKSKDNSTIALKFDINFSNGKRKTLFK